MKVLEILCKIESGAGRGTAGAQQGSMLLATNPDGTLHYSFMETMIAIFPYYKIRAVSGFIYLAGLALFIYNIYKTYQKGADLQSAKA